MNIPEGWEEKLLAEMDRRFQICNARGKFEDEALVNDDTQQGVELAIDFIRSLAAAPPPPAQDNPWQQAVLNECFAIEGCYKESDPAGTLTCLINWHVLNERDHAPEQEDEPVLFVNSESIKGLHKLMASRKRTDAFNMPLYTHPDTSELRKAAEDAYQLFTIMRLNGHVTPGTLPRVERVQENLRAALEGESC